MSEFKTDVAHRAGINHKSSHALSRLPIARTDKEKVYDEVQLLTINLILITAMYNVDTEQEEEDGQEYSRLQRKYVPFLAEVFALADIGEE